MGIVFVVRAARGRSLVVEETVMATEKTYTVTGMTCSHCVNSVDAELRQIPGVTDVKVDLASGAVTVASDAPLDETAVAAAVDEAGYELAR
jgi:copper chaperone CopZ